MDILLESVGQTRSQDKAQARYRVTSVAWVQARRREYSVADPNRSIGWAQGRDKSGSLPPPIHRVIPLPQTGSHYHAPRPLSRLWSEVRMEPVETSPARKFPHWEDAGPCCPEGCLTGQQPKEQGPSWVLGPRGPGVRTVRLHVNPPFEF